MSKLLSLDQSSQVSGYGVFIDQELIDYGHFTCKNSDIGKRLDGVRKNVINLIDKYDIDEIVFEDIQLQDTHGENVNTFKVLAEVFGVISQLCIELKIPYFNYTPTEWRKKLAFRQGRGVQRATQKAQAKQYIKEKFNIEPTEDECEAICIGLAHLKNDIFDWS